MQLPRLKEWREFRGFTQPELAERAGLSLRTVFNYEHGGNALPNNARKLATALGIEVGDLISEEAHPKGSAPPSVQLTLNGLLVEERRPTDRETKALTRHLTYVERRLEADSMSRDEVADELDIFLAFGRTMRETHSGALADRYIALIERVFQKAKEVKARRNAAAEGVLEDMREWQRRRAS